MAAQVDFCLFLNSFLSCLQFGVWKSVSGNLLYLIKRSFTCPIKEIFLLLCRALVRPHLEYGIQANCPYLKKDIYHLESIQLAATRWVKGLRDLSYEERL